MTSKRARTLSLASVLLFGCGSLLGGGCGDDAAPADSEPDAGRAQNLDAGPTLGLDARVGDRDGSTSVRPDATVANDDGGPADLASGLDAAVVSGTPLRVLTYNVAGLPEGISGSMPSLNSTLISPLLNDYDLALLQEDFSYHAQIISMARHAYQSPADTRGNSLGDGLSFLSTAPFTDFKRDAWADCYGVFDSGSDCLTPKGFTMARFKVAGRFEVDVYDMHADAGNSAPDIAAREGNLRQLAEAIRTRSEGHAVIVVGDFNARYTSSGPILAEFVSTTQLRDVWVELYRSGTPPAAGSASSCLPDAPNAPECERIDKIFYRTAGSPIALRPHDYKVEGAKFTDPSGTQLSDHRPASVVFDLSDAPTL